VVSLHFVFKPFPRTCVRRIVHRAPAEASGLVALTEPRRGKGSLCFFRLYESANNASAKGETDTARARHNNGRKVHNNTPNAEDRPRHVLMDNADQRLCSRPAGRPRDFAMAKSYAARLERTRQQERRL
jgi:hypothetical protein